MAFDFVSQQVVLPDSRLDLIGIERTVQFVGQYRVGNELVNSIAHMAAVDAKYSRLLACDAGGRLYMSNNTPPFVFLIAGTAVTGPAAYSTIVSTTDAEYHRVTMACETEAHTFRISQAGLTYLMRVYPGNPLAIHGKITLVEAQADTVAATASAIIERATVQ